MGRPITDREIYVYTCVNDPSRKAVAMISGFDWVFRGETPIKAKNAADAWRREAVRNDKLIPKIMKAELLGEAGQ